jgi:glucokinase
LEDGDPSATIAKAALDGTYEICVQALDIFVSIYGAEAGNLALKLVATGGTFVGGGIAPKILAKLRGPAFMDAFKSKGRLTGLLEDIPVRVITNDKTALLGAGRVAALSVR